MVPFFIQLPFCDMVSQMKRAFSPLMGTYMSSVEFVSIRYDCGDSEEYAPDRTYISGRSSETGSVTICFENSEDEGGASHLTLVARRAVIPASGPFGQYIARIIMPAMLIDLQVISVEAQQYWVEALSCESQPSVPHKLHSHHSHRAAAWYAPAERASLALHDLHLTQANNGHERKAQASTDASTVCELLVSAPLDAYNCRVTEI